VWDNRSSSELRHMAAKPVVRRSVEEMVATICYLRIRMVIGSLFMRRTEGRVVNRGLVRRRAR